MGRQRVAELEQQLVVLGACGHRLDSLGQLVQAVRRLDQQVTCGQQLLGVEGRARPGLQQLGGDVQASRHILERLVTQHAALGHVDLVGEHPAGGVDHLVDVFGCLDVVQVEVDANGWRVSARQELNGLLLVSGDDKHAGHVLVGQLGGLQFNGLNCGLHLLGGGRRQWLRLLRLDSSWLLGRDDLLDLFDSRGHSARHRLFLHLDGGIGHSLLCGLCGGLLGGRGGELIHRLDGLLDDLQHTAKASHLHRLIHGSLGRGQQSRLRL